MQWLIVLSFFCSCASTQYFSKSVANRKVEFLVPPHGDFKTDDRGHIKKECRYQCVEITGMNVDYFTSLNNLNNARYITSSKDLFKPGIPYSNGEIEEPDSALLSPDNSFRIRYSRRHANLILQIDFDKFLSMSDSLMVATFDFMARQLLIYLSFKEKGSVQPGFNWPQTIAQNIVAKIFELIPAPQETSPARAGYIRNQYYSIILLNPAIRLKIDNTILITDPLLTNTKLYTLTGTTTLSLSRIFSNNGDFFWKQLPYSGLKNQVFPNNSINGNPLILYLGSTADIELTRDLFSSRYLALFHTYLKPTNTNDTFVNTDIQNYNNPPHPNDFVFNSRILYSDNIKTMLDPATDPKLPNIPSFQKFAVFGQRSLITAEIPVYVNSVLNYFVFGTSIGDLIGQKIIPIYCNMTRDYGNKPAKFHSVNPNIVLLPGDNLKF